MIRQGQVDFVALFHALEANTARSSSRLLGELSISQFSVFRHIYDPDKNFQKTFEVIAIQNVLTIL